MPAPSAGSIQRWAIALLALGAIGWVAYRGLVPEISDISPAFRVAIPAVLGTGVALLLAGSYFSFFQLIKAKTAGSLGIVLCVLFTIPLVGMAFFYGGYRLLAVGVVAAFGGLHASVAGAFEILLRIDPLHPVQIALAAPAMFGPGGLKSMPPIAQLAPPSILIAFAAPIVCLALWLVSRAKES